MKECKDYQIYQIFMPKNMRQLVTSIISLIGITLFGMGCNLAPIEVANINENINSAPVANQNNNNGMTQESSEEDYWNVDIDKKNWEKYSNDEYQFSFTHPPQWVPFNSPFNVKIVKYDDALESSDEVFGYKKEELDLMKLELEQKSKMKINSVPIELYNNYDVPGGTFYREAYFFIDKDLIRFIIPLPIGTNFKYPENKDEIWELLDKINEREVDEKSLLLIDTFDEVIKGITFFE